MSFNTSSSSAPSEKTTTHKGVVVGRFPAPNAIGNEFSRAHVRFADGHLLHPIFDALVYDGNELLVGGRKVIRQQGFEFWIVRLGAAENELNGAAWHACFPST